jgi:hypothetical protein
MPEINRGRCYNSGPFFIPVFIVVRLNGGNSLLVYFASPQSDALSHREVKFLKLDFPWRAAVYPGM